MYYIGIDPGYARLGYGIITHPKNSNIPEYTTSGVIETAAELPPEERLFQIYDQLEVLLKQYTPAQCVIENLYFNKNTTTAMMVSEARGIILLQMHRHNVPVLGVSPSSVKKMITGNGKGTKEQVKKMVCRYLRVDNIPGHDDASDGVAMALFAWLKRR